MDEKFKKSCPNCSQLYTLKALSPEADLNIPLFLKCGHSMSETCVRNIVKLEGAVECKICQRVTEFMKNEAPKLMQSKEQFYKLFPVNVNMLGELALELITEKSELEENPKEDFFVDLEAILSSPEQTKGQCLECHSETLTMCRQCATVICEDCFDKSHKNFAVFKTHILMNIEVQIIPNYCEIHSGKSLDYYCKDCDKLVCLDCFMVSSEKSCKSHTVVPTTEMNKAFLDDLREVSPQVDTMFRRLSKTAVDIGHLLQNIDDDDGSSDLKKVTATIEQHFSKLHAEIQTHKKEVLGIIAKLKGIEKDSLVKAKNDVAKALKDSKNVMSSLKSALNCEKNKSTNLSTVLDDAKKLLTRPWYLSRDESKKAPLKVTVNDDLCMLISDYIQLEGNAKALYKLRATHELDGVEIPPPPIAAVYPPGLSKDAINNSTEPVIEKPLASKAIQQDQQKSISKDSIHTNGNIRSSTPELQKPVLPDEPVLPSAKKYNLKPLKTGKLRVKEGNKELAKITHMVDLDEFYVQRPCEEAVLNEMMEELLPNLRQITKEISIGAMYVAKHNNIWKRCRVDSIDMNIAKNPTFNVTCLDFGYTVPVKIDQLRDAPTTFAVGSSKGRYPVPLAIRCRLANCKPKNGVWTKSDVAFVRNMTDDKQVIIEVRYIGEICACDVMTLDGASIAQALAFHSRAVLLQPNLPTYVQDDFTKLCDCLNKSYSLSDPAGSIFLPESGLVCVVFVSTDRKEPEGLDYFGWARGVVKSVGDGVVDVFLPDIGCCLDVKWDQLRRIKQKFTVLRGLASECYLTGLGKKLCKEATDHLNSYKGRVLKLEVDKKQDRKTIGAILYCESEKKTICINREILKYGLAEATGLNNNQLLNLDNESVGKVPEIKPSSSTNLAKITSPELPTMPKTVKKEPKGPLRLEAKILHYESPSLVYISVIPQQKTFNELFEDIQKFYTKRKTTRRDNWKVNDRCCAFCIQSETWRRATILDIRKDNATVFYTDFACTETIPISNLKKLHPDFEVIGDAAIKCHLAGIVPAGGDEWPSLTKDFLKEKLDSYKRIFITRVGQFIDKSMPIELWVYHTDHGSALEPDKSEWRCLNKAIIDQGLGIPDKQHQDLENPDNELSFLNMTGSVNDWLQIPPLRVTPVMSSGDSSTSSPVKTGHNYTSENTLFISDWLPAEPLMSTEFTGTPTYIDNDGIIYLHDVSQSDILELIRDSLEVGFKEEDPKAQYYNWRVGEPCVARYYLDNSFYRGTVVEVNKGQLNCTIQYVDYGNYEVCAFSDLRKGIALHQIPIQAHMCSLSRIRPIGGKWDLPALDYIHKAIVEKKCFVKVAGEPVDGVVPIDLKYDKLWINDHLVEFDMATYTDGSKPLLRQFVPIEGKVVKTERVIKIDTVSEPDYIVEEENVSSEASGSPDSFKISTLTDTHNETYELEETVGNFVSYPEHEGQEFDCNISIINDTNSLELSIIWVEENALYEKLFATVEKEGETMPPLDGVFENKACIALFQEDNKWYRAVILQYSESKNLVKVRYVDYGNIGIIHESNVREIKEEWVNLPPASISARLHGVKVNEDYHPDDVSKAYIATFLDKGPFRVKIVHYKNSMPCVVLRNAEQELVYQELIDSRVFLCDTCENFA